MQLRKEELQKKKNFMLQATARRENIQTKPKKKQQIEKGGAKSSDLADIKDLVKVLKKIYRTIFFNEHPLAFKNEETKSPVAKEVKAEIKASEKAS